MEAFDLYCDKSASGQGRYHSIAAVSGPPDAVCRLREELRCNLPSGREVKFGKLTGDSEMTAATRAFIGAGLRAAKHTRVRIDVVTWDIRDERHAIMQRDDSANIGRMAYHLVTVIARRHGHHLWRLFPDAGEGADWQDLAAYLDATALSGPRRVRPEEQPLVDMPDTTLTIETVEERDSASEPLIQLADLFAGFASFSHEEGSDCLTWRAGHRCVATLPGLSPELTATPQLSRAKPCKYELLIALYETARSLKLGVGLESKKHLVTHKPSNPVSFWPYDPQHPEDKAPVHT